MYSPPFITVKVGRMVDGGATKILYTFAGTDFDAVSRALDTLGFVFHYVEAATGIVIFRGLNGQRAWYTQIKDHNPTKETP